MIITRCDICKDTLEGVNLRADIHLTSKSGISVSVSKKEKCLRCAITEAISMLAKELS